MSNVGVNQKDKTASAVKGASFEGVRLWARADQDRDHRARHPNQVFASY